MVEFDFVNLCPKRKGVLAASNTTGRHLRLHREGQKLVIRDTVVDERLGVKLFLNFSGYQTLPDAN